MLSVPRLFRMSALFRTRQLASQLCGPGWGAGVVRGTQTECPVETEFQASRQKLATLGEPRTDVKVQLFALFQQATVGRCNVAKPDRMDFVTQAKWDAWSQLQAMPREEAKKQYIDLVKRMAAGSGVSRTFYTRSSALRAAVLEQWSDDLRVTKEGHVIYIRFNRPAKKNALTLQMYDEIALTLENAGADSDIYMVVFTGTGDYYSSGNDLTNLTNIDPESIETQTKEIKAVIKNFVQSFIDFPKPLIALVNGPAVGIAVSLLGLFDAVYAVDTATFYTPFMQLGQCPVGCSSYLFPRMMGSAKAGEMLMFNRKLTAQGALERNLVTQVFTENIFHRETQALIAGFVELPPKGLQTAKMLLRKAERQKLQQANEEECEALLDRWKSEECWNAVFSNIHQRPTTTDTMDDV